MKKFDTKMKEAIESKTKGFCDNDFLREGTEE